ncbi:TerB family tellurite resistance protein [Echinimonas agarilytica]|uniref:TerB family tellurite resistance protein n=1 Tax=Echinimonas agarilytica TaxID=1215918 RepID=A0AA41WB97_9GAMM|nr:TerB family tellurite resistance protein [Echinimonas agarilytica]MCM2681201.1 TerB family tellurite resistance protein [Echinimonas agarilytica]
MLNKLSGFFESLTESNTAANDTAIDQPLAIAALLVEVATSDGNTDPREINIITSLMQKLFDVGADEVNQLVKRAQTSSENATCMHQFTSVIKQAPLELRHQVVLALWKVSYADGQLDPYEEATIRKVSDLLYVSHSDFVKNKLDAQAIMGIA